MYKIIIKNSVTNSPIQEFGRNDSPNIEHFQIVLKDKSQYKALSELVGLPYDFFDELIGKISIPTTDTNSITKIMSTLVANKLVDKLTMDTVLQAIIPGLTASAAPATAAVPELKSSVQADQDPSEEIAQFFDEHLDKHISPLIVSPYPNARDGGLNPALKIYGSVVKKNTIEDGRWEIFCLLKNEEGRVGMRSGIKSETWDYNDLKVTEQFNFSFFPNPLVREIKERLLNYRSGHPSLALDFTQLDKGIFQTLPVYGGGWLIRNDLAFLKRVQIYWSSGRYNRDLTPEASHLMELAVAFQLMSEYGKDYRVEFHQFGSTTMENFITQKIIIGKIYRWQEVVDEVLRLKAKDVMSQGSNAFSI